MITWQDVLDGECTEDEYEAYIRWAFRMWKACGGLIPGDKPCVWKNYSAEYKECCQ